MDRFEVLILPSNPQRARGILDACARYGTATDKYHGDEKNLILWGVGGSVQQESYHKHRAAGGNVIMLDVGYFCREQKYARMSINDYHPQNLLQYAGDGSRFAQHKIRLKNHGNPDGHILLCGLGKKSRILFGYKGAEWETRKAAEIRAAYPGRKIIYRPKPRMVETIAGCEDGHGGTIDDHLHGCALVVAKHSNAAVDACIHGVHVVCSDGAASYLYGDDILNPKSPDYYARLDFLNRLAWFNWHANEAGKMLEFVTHILQAKP